MLAELSIRNMKRSLRDYSIYILTLTISFTLIYAFNLICYSPDLMKLSASMEDFREVNKLIAIIFACVMSAIMAIQQLGDLARHRRHYKRLSQLGMSGYRIDCMILQQMLIHFAVPLLLSIPISISLFNSIGYIFNSYVNKPMMYRYMLGTLIGFGMIYSLYFMLTYLSFVKEIKREVT